ncbi:PEST proteolytic signal-containing nuclear protein isoform X1 [Numida meleagris]|uniref:PEST proteolytic signal-containing nuclear protein isoform X1 n=1 Tax=Numida meleagris TaxID=8996 RepID=UPI000B3DD89D|nr:PEST proteolytic signal-containing nuclear protein isoform X1 [Numida meleagris]
MTLAQSAGRCSTRPGSRTHPPEVRHTCASCSSPALPARFPLSSEPLRLSMAVGGAGGGGAAASRRACAAREAEAGENGGRQSGGGEGEAAAARRSNGGESSSRSAEKRAANEEAEDFTTKPAPAKMSKFGFSIGSQTSKKASAISIKLAANKPKEPVPTLAPKTLSVAAAFNEDEDSEPEEMPPEAKMRMKNIGRDTPTSAGPNSFNKGKHGFSDNQKLWERNIKSHLGNIHDQENN